MKLKHVVIENFKGIQSVEFPTDEAPNALGRLTALLGDNGSGKTTVLQAIALTLSMATRRTRDMASFNWHGFLPERVPSLGSTFVELHVAFEPEEISLTHDLFLAWEDSLPPRAQADDEDRATLKPSRGDPAIRTRPSRFSRRL